MNELTLKETSWGQGNPLSAKDAMGNDIEIGGRYGHSYYVEGILWIYLVEAKTDLVEKDGTMKLKIVRQGLSRRRGHPITSVEIEEGEDFIIVWPEVLLPVSVSSCKWK